MTSYYNYSSDVFGTTTISAIINVTPIGPVTAISTSVITTTFDDADDGVTFDYTLTSLFLEPTGSWCADPLVAYGNTKICTGTQGVPPFPSLGNNSLVQTRYFVPVLITQPSSCTKTSFSYTSSLMIYPEKLPGLMYTQATLSGEATFITTIVEVISTNLGGQAVTASVIEVYLNTDAVQSVKPSQQAKYLSECVDPSSFLCPAPTPTALSFGCGPQPITYPPLAQAAGSSATQAASTAGSGTGPKTTSKSGAEELRRPGSWSMYLAAAALAGFTLL